MLSLTLHEAILAPTRCPVEGPELGRQSQAPPNFAEPSAEGTLGGPTQEQSRQELTDQMELRDKGCSCLGLAGHDFAKSLSMLPTP